MRNSTNGSGRPTVRERTPAARENLAERRRHERDVGIELPLPLEIAQQIGPILQIDRRTAEHAAQERSAETEAVENRHRQRNAVRTVQPEPLARMANVRQEALERPGHQLRSAEA